MHERYIQIQPKQGVVGVPLMVEVAITDEEKDYGLMFRPELPENRGMLFIFEEPMILSFWMKNTYISLSIAYLDIDGYIVELHDADPLDETGHPSAVKCKYALEVNRGWFKRHNLDVGAQVLLDNIKSGIKG